ncbi:uncharacterized protein LOC134181126 [Corticium candelabrum]|uniref:uncharacterized protein LOC134181126 n=1 Tax=Corticium candelabrum TaxID=121492 RepID=UPI002E2649AF|nr:uncharacterized protein LOC134181126 [Corticium candelabrum]
MVVFGYVRWLFVFALGVTSLQAGSENQLGNLGPSKGSDVVLQSSQNIVASCNGWLDTSLCPLKQDLSRGLVLHYTFDNADNLAQDSTENGYNGKVVGLVTHSSGVLGGAAYFVGTFSKIRQHHYIEIPNVINTRAYTVAMWINLKLPEGHNTLLMLHGAQSSWPASNLFIFTSHGKLAVFQSQQDVRYDDFPLPLSNTYPNLVPRMSNAPSLTAYTWHHIAVTYSEGRLSAYVDGLLAYEFINVRPVPETPKSQSLYVGDCLCVHSSHPTSYEIEGSVDDLRVYNRALGPLEVKQLGS